MSLVICMVISPLREDVIHYIALPARPIHRVVPVQFEPVPDEIPYPARLVIDAVAVVIVERTLTDKVIHEYHVFENNGPLVPCKKHLVSAPESFKIAYNRWRDPVS